LPGHLPKPICLVAWELRTGRRLKIWEEELQQLAAPPYGAGSDTLVVAYYASAEMGCHLALGWPLPENVLDLYAEFRCQTNGWNTPCGNGLLGALTWYGLQGLSTVEKDNMRELALRGGPWTVEERISLLDYCESDVEALTRLLGAMAPSLDIQRALLRGRFMNAAARIEANGVPIDSESWQQLQDAWPDLQDQLIKEIDQEYGVFEGRSFRASKFAEWLSRADIPWPRLASGKLDLSDNAFREMARSHPKVAPLRELRSALAQMRLAELPVGLDGRNRCLLSAFQARTSRNQPSNSRFIFGPSVWLRHLIQSRPGHGVAYIDWSQQEFGIAAALSGDRLMQQAYLSGDPYLEFAKQAGAAPPEATKATHSAVREQFKACVLAVQYGMGPDSLAERIGQPVAAARELLRLHTETYRVFWQWSDAALDRAMLHGSLPTVFGWKLHIGGNANPRSIRNFPMQANGAEMLRLACCLVTEAGVRVCAPVHDAILIEARLDTLDEAIATTEALMAEASRIVLDGFVLRSDAKAFRYPERYSDARGVQMWETVRRVLAGLRDREPDPAPPVCTSAP
jgi:DNA polymerase I